MGARLSDARWWTELLEDKPHEEMPGVHVMVDVYEDMDALREGRVSHREHGLSCWCRWKHPCGITL